MEYRIIGVLDRRRKPIQNKTYLRRCTDCSSLYRTRLKYSALCRNCRNITHIKKTCKSCSAEKQFGDKEDYCPACRRERTQVKNKTIVSITLSQ